jgi:integrase
MSKRVASLGSEEAVLFLRALRPGVGAGAAERAAVRNWTMGMVMLEAGLRVGELVGLDIPDLLFRGAPVRSLVVRAEIAKGHRERLIPVSTRLSGAIEEMLRRVWGWNGCPIEGPAWYCGPKRRRVSARWVEAFVRKAGETALGRPVWPHMLRHTFGTRMERLAGIRVAQELLGHADISTTAIYCHPNSDDLVRAVNGEARIPDRGL